MRIGFMVLAAVLLLSGCGQAKDPFVGTWRPTIATRSTVRLVISKQTDGYRVGNLVFARHGNVLTDRFRVKAPGERGSGTMVKLSFVFVPSSGHLLETSGNRRLVELVKTSDSTSRPSTSPSSPAAGYPRPYVAERRSAT